jgi:hypothetical protein
VKVDVYNPTDQPVTVDADGHIVGGREHATVDDRHGEVAAALAGGRLVTVDKPRKTAKSSSKSKSTTSSGEPQAVEQEES